MQLWNNPSFFLNGTVKSTTALKKMHEREQRGIRLGKKDGIKETQLKTAKKMLDLNMDIPTIMKITGLSKKKILELKKGIH